MAGRAIHRSEKLPSLIREGSIDAEFHLTEEWIEAERKIYDFMTELNPENQNYLEEGFPQPRFEVVEP